MCKPDSRFASRVAGCANRVTTGVQAGAGVQAVAGVQTGELVCKLGNK